MGFQLHSLPQNVIFKRNFILESEKMYFNVLTFMLLTNSSTILFAIIGYNISKVFCMGEIQKYFVCVQFCVGNPR